MKKRLSIILLLILITLFGCENNIVDVTNDGDYLGGGDSSWEVQQGDGIVKYYILEDQKSVAIYSAGDYYKPTGELIIPSVVTYNGMEYTVTTVEKNLLSKLTSVRIPSTVTTILRDYPCYIGLEYIELVNIEVSRENQHFSSDTCGVLYNKDKTKLIMYPTENRRSKFVIPNSVDTIAKGAFYGGEFLTEIIIGNSVTTIDDFAFGYCRLQKIEIPNSVETISETALFECHYLKSVNIGNNLKKIKESDDVLKDIFRHSSVPFIDSYYLNNIVVHKDNAFFSSDSNGVLYNKDKTVLLQYPRDSEKESFVIPNSVTTIAKVAFMGCSNLKNITLSDNIKVIEKYVFQGCSNLNSIKLGNNIKEIGKGAFLWCQDLESVHIGDSVEIIGDGAFEHCSKLKNINLPKNLKTIGNGAFYGCNQLKNINLPNGLKTIGNNAFSGCDQLKQIEIPNSVKVIGESAFAYSDSLISIKIPDSVKVIKRGVFQFCNNLKNVELANIEVIERFAFNECISLKNIIIPNTVKIIEDNSFQKCLSLDSITIPNSVEIIREEIFNGCDSLTNIFIGSGVNQLAINAFYGCASLKNIFLDSNNLMYSFDSCGVLYNKDKTVLIKNILDKTDFIVPNSVKIIEKEAFANSASLKNINLASVLSIGTGVFYNCENLTSVIIPSSVSSLGIGVFNKCTNLETIIMQRDIPPSVEGNLYWELSDSAKVFIPTGTRINYDPDGDGYWFGFFIKESEIIK